MAQTFVKCVEQERRKIEAETGGREAEENVKVNREQCLITIVVLLIILNPPEYKPAVVLLSLALDPPPIVICIALLLSRSKVCIESCSIKPAGDRRMEGGLDG